MSSIVEANLDWQRRRLNKLQWIRRKQELSRGLLAFGEGGAQREWRRVEPYDFGQRHGKEAVPFFGSDPYSGPFMDYVQTKSVQVPPIGYRPGANVPVSIVNRSGSTANLKPLHTHGKSELESSRRNFANRGTDQKLTKSRRSSGSSWDGKIRIHDKMKTFESSRERSETHRDRLTKEMQNEPYSFFQ